MKGLMAFIFGVLAGSLFTTGLTLRLISGNWGAPGPDGCGYGICFVIGSILLVIGVILGGLDANGQLDDIL